MFNETAWDAGLWLWVVIDIAAVIILGLAMWYGTRMWRQRSADPVTLRESDEATRRMYHSDDKTTDRQLYR